MLRFDLPGGVSLRLLEESDADALYALTDRNRSHLDRWLPWVPVTRAPNDSLQFIRATRRQLADNDGFQLAIVADGAIAGMVGFHRVDWVNRATSIGYWLAADRQGRGTMTAAARALVDHAFGAWDLHRVEIAAAVDNARSRAVARRLGFREEGVRREVERLGERFVDHVVYAQLADEWRAGRSGGPAVRA